MGLRPLLLWREKMKAGLDIREIDNLKECKRVRITIGDKRYTLSETIDGKLEIHASGYIAVYPSSANVVNIDSEGEQW